ncbi:MAG: DUF1801 domain-containing protein [Flavobacteriaceae bacterium]|nr:DUF1801 domain-containing protein [Flavobacteriaceae bacterium]
MKPAEDYIVNQQEPFRSILMHLKAVIEHTIPDAELLFKWKVPFYYVDKRPLCYIHRPVEKDYVDIGFWNAAHLTVLQEHMTKDGRKMMKSLLYKSIENIDDKVFKDILKDVYNVKGQKFWK